MWSHSQINVFVSNVKKTNVVKMNVTDAAILQYYNISNPGLLEQEPGQEQGLIVFLYESFYDGKYCWNQRRLWRTLDTHRAFPLCVFCGELLVYLTGRKTCHMRGRQRVFLLCVFWYDPADSQTDRKPCHTGCRSIASPPYEFLYVSSSFLPQKRSFHTEGRGRAFVLCGF